MYKKEDGFTLIEMLIVMSVIAILIVLISPRLGDQSKQVNEQSYEAVESFINAQIQSYYLDNQVYPASIEALESSGYIKLDTSRYHIVYENNKATVTNAR